MGLISRGTGIQVNNWLLITILTIVFLGTMYPLATDLLLNKSLTVGPKYYSTTIAPIIILFLFFMFISPRLGWTDTKLYKIIIQLRVKREYLFLQILYWIKIFLFALLILRISFQVTPLLFIRSLSNFISIRLSSFSILNIKVSSLIKVLSKRPKIFKFFCFNLLNPNLN